MTTTTAAPSTIALPFRTSKDKEDAAMFMQNLQYCGMAFDATIEVPGYITLTLR